MKSRFRPRIICATNKDLKEEIKEGRFREDLYHRLSVILIKVPSLNERTTDIPLLIKHFLTQVSESYGTAPMAISDEAINYLSHVDWTGNIRQLRNTIERLVIMSDETITFSDAKKFA